MAVCVYNYIYVALFWSLFLQTMKKAESEGRKAKVSDFEKLIEDASFLNALQSGVNRWIREIQKVGFL